MHIDVEQVVREYIGKTVHMSLATVSGDAPWVCEVHFAYDDNLNLYFRSLRTRRRSQEIAANPKVAGDIIDKYGPGEQVVGLYFEGTARLLEAGAEQQLAADCLQNGPKSAADLLEEAKREDGHQFYKISVANWYVFGRFGSPSGQKHKLAWNGNKR